MSFFVNDKRVKPNYIKNKLSELSFFKRENDRLLHENRLLKKRLMQKEIDISELNGKLNKIVEICDKHIIK